VTEIRFPVVLSSLSTFVSPLEVFGRLFPNEGETEVQDRGGKNCPGVADLQRRSRGLISSEISSFYLPPFYKIGRLGKAINVHADPGTFPCAAGYGIF